METGNVSRQPFRRWWHRRPGAAARLAAVLLFAVIECRSAAGGAGDPWVEYQGGNGPGAGKHIVLVAGDEEYRSEEALPMLAKILSVRHGFRCTVLFSINPQDGTIDPNNQTNIPGLEALEQADMMVIATRFRELPDAQMAHIDRFVHSGKPILGLRTATHAFAYRRNPKSRYAKYDYRSREWPGGFGQQVLGDTWISHHGHHGHESTRGVINPELADHPILRGVDDIWGPTDVYTIKHLPADAKVLVRGQVLSGMKPTDPPNRDKPMMPLVWVRHFDGGAARPSRVICTTMGASVDLQSEGLRRVLVNACYWGLGLEDRIPPKSNVDYVGPYHPTFFGTNKFQRGMRPADFALREFRAGAAAVDVSPLTLPARIAGYFRERQSDQIRDRLMSRALVLDDGATRLAIAIVDNLMIPRELLDRAKRLASGPAGIPVERMLIAATHTHSAPAAMGALGTRADESYRRQLPAQIARSIVLASRRLAPARIGWSVVTDRRPCKAGCSRSVEVPSACGRRRPYKS